MLYETSIKVFHEKYYSSAMAKLSHHLPHVKILGTNETGDTRRKALHSRGHLGDIGVKKDFVEKFLEAGGVQIQSEHWGENRMLSMEGVTVEGYKCKDEVRDTSTTNVFHSYLSENGKQDAADSASHMMHLYAMLLKWNLLIAFMSTVWESTDGCAKQYCCASAIFFMVFAACQFDVVIDPAVGAPGHGKDVVDGLNAHDKWCL